MTNWLESEEKKKKIELEKFTLERNEELIRRQNSAQDIAQKDDIIHNNLKAFYELCNRFKHIDSNTLTIEKLKVFTEKALPAYISNSLFEKREICFLSTPSDHIIIEIQQYKYSVFYSSLDGSRMDTVSSKKLFLRKTCLNHDLLDWDEEKMINTIRWITSKYDSVKESLPGENEGLTKEDDYDNNNKVKSIGKGILWALIGLPIGFIGGGILAFLIWMLLALFGNDIGDKGMNNIVWVIIVISGIIGYYFGFSVSRKKY